MSKRSQTFLTRLRAGAFAPVDVASIVFFRIAFGLLMAWHVWAFFTSHRIAVYWFEPHFLFKYYGFSWVQPWPGNGLYVHCVVLGIFALFLAAGFVYRFSAALFFLGYLYFFLLDEGRYQNHQYLICLFGFLLIFIPAHRAFSVDAKIRPKLRTQTAPAWALWLLRVQMGVVYFYGGIAKMNLDWFRGEPMRWLMAQHRDFLIIGRFFTQEWAVYLMSYSSLLFDLCIVPCLLWRRTRLAAFIAAVLFHLINARFFAIDIFPWLAIAATSLFLSPDWPRRVVLDQSLNSVASPRPAHRIARTLKSDARIHRLQQQRARNFSNLLARNLRRRSSPGLQRSPNHYEHYHPTHTHHHRSPCRLKNRSPTATVSHQDTSAYLQPPSRVIPSKKN